MSDRRRHIPRLDQVLADPALAEVPAHEMLKKSVVRRAQAAARAGDIAPEDVAAHARSLLPRGASSMTPVINATGIIVHTNIGRAPLAPRAVDAMSEAASYVDVELDLATGTRSRDRGAGARRALLARCPQAEDALVVNNGAAALSLAMTALAADGEVVWSRGELVEIGAGFRLAELVAATGVAIREVGTTNRTHPADYRRALTERTRAILKVHPSNYLVSGFTSTVSIPELRRIADDAQVPLIVDLGSGLLVADPALPDEPDATSALKAGADAVIMSGDKLLGGPQAGIILGLRELLARLRRHPLARAMRIDKVRLAALEATLLAEATPVASALHLDGEEYLRRTQRLAERVGARVVEHDGRVGGGGAPEVPLPGYALELPAHLAERLRAGDPAVLARVAGGICLVDLRCVPPAEDAVVGAAIDHVWER